MGPQAIWMGERGCWLGSLPRQGCRLGFLGSQFSDQAFWVYRTAEATDWLPCLGRCWIRLHSHYDPLTQGPRSNRTTHLFSTPPLSFLAKQGCLLCSAAGQKHYWTSAVNKNAVYQDLRAGSKLHSVLHLSLIPCGWVLDSPSDSHETRPKWAFEEASHNTGGARCQPKILILPLRNLKPREGSGRPSALSPRPRGEAMQSV